MVYIFYTRTDKKLNNNTFNRYLKNLPFELQTRILKYRHWEDAQRTVLGKALLIDGLYYLGFKNYFLKDVRLSEFNKPYFDNSIDFNISHSGEFVVCAISLAGSIGIDIEEIKPIVFTELQMFFSDNECNKIEQSHNSTISFYKYWTQKEAFLKAIGMGLHVPINEVEILDNKITWNNIEWFLQEIKLDERYISYLSGKSQIVHIKVEKINYN